MSSLCAGAHTPVLLQTAVLELFNLEFPSNSTLSRAMLDSGSQRTYVTSRLRDILNLPTVGTESLSIKTFGSSEGHQASYDLVQLGLTTKDNESLQMSALVVPFICNPLTSQPINRSGENYVHLLGLDLADSANITDSLEVDVLIGSDSYWSLVTGRIVRGKSGHTAIHTKVGWILSRPVEQQEVTTNLSLTSVHTLRVDAYPVGSSLDDCLKQFWELESLGRMEGETSMYEKFVQQMATDMQ